MPNLIERAGVGKFGHGSITAVYTVLAENDDTSDPIVDIARASLDGQVILARKLADSAHYPSIDLNGSISRVMQNLVDEQTHLISGKFRRLWSLYQQNEDLIQVGAYKAGTNPELDEAIKLRPSMVSFLQQDMNTPEDFAVSISKIRDLIDKSSPIQSPQAVNPNIKLSQTENSQLQATNSANLKPSNNSSAKAASNFNTGNRLIQ